MQLRASNILMTIFFSYAAYLQLNDNHNVLIWFSMYLMSALLALSNATINSDTKKPIKLVQFLNIVVATFAVAFLANRCIHSTTDKSFDYTTEFGRENFGLIIVFGWLLFGNRFSQHPLLGVGVVGVALALVTSVYYVPNFIMAKNNTTVIKNYATDEKPVLGF
jgi:hypothetical protein